MQKLLEFRRGFEELLSLYRYKIEEEIEKSIKKRKELEQNPNSSYILKELLKLIISGGYRRETWCSGFEREIELKIGNNFSLDFLNSPEGRKILNTINMHGNEGKVNNLLDELRNKTIKEWTEEGYEFIRSGNYKDALKSLGKDAKKSKDIHLRDVGYFDRIPIDFHEERFLVRTGIFHDCFSNENCDPLDYDTLEEILTKFSKKYLSDIKLKGFDLGECAGIVDWMIWIHCAERGKNVCAKVPKCFENPNACPLFKKACLLSMRIIG